MNGPKIIKWALGVLVSLVVLGGAVWQVGNTFTPKVVFETVTGELGEGVQALRFETQQEFIERDIDRERGRVDKYIERAEDEERELKRYEKRRVQTLERNIKKLKDKRKLIQFKIKMKKQRGD